DAGTRVVFDGAAADASIVTFSGDSEAFSLNFFGNSTVALDLKSHEVRVASGFRVSNQATSVHNGTLTFHSERENESLIDFSGADLDNVQMSITAGDWRIVSAGQLDQVSISNARVDTEIASLRLSRFELQQGAILDGDLQEVVFSEAISIRESSSLNT